MSRIWTTAYMLTCISSLTIHLYMIWFKWITYGLAIDASIMQLDGRTHVIYLIIGHVYQSLYMLVAWWRHVSGHLQVYGLLAYHSVFAKSVVQCLTWDVVMRDIFIPTWCLISWLTILYYFWLVLCSCVIKSMNKRIQVALILHCMWCCVNE